jgi:hypothetical protein
MPDDSVDWDSLLEQRLNETGQQRRDEEQASEPPPGPEAARELLDRLLDAAESGELRTATAGQPPPPASTPVEAMEPAIPVIETPPAAVSAPPPPAHDGGWPVGHDEPSPSARPAPAPPMLRTGSIPRPTTRPRPPSERLRPISYVPTTHRQGRGRRRGRRRLYLDRLKRVAFWIVLLIILLGGIGLTFWPQAVLQFQPLQEPSELTPEIDWGPPKPVAEGSRSAPAARPEGEATRAAQKSTDDAAPTRREVRQAGKRGAPSVDRPRRSSRLPREDPPQPEPLPPADSRSTPDPGQQDSARPRKSIPRSRVSNPGPRTSRTGGPAVKPGLPGAPDPSSLAPPVPPKPVRPPAGKEAGVP